MKGLNIFIEGTPWTLGSSIGALLDIPAKYADDHAFSLFTGLSAIPIPQSNCLTKLIRYKPLLVAIMLLVCRTRGDVGFVT